MSPYDRESYMSPYDRESYWRGHSSYGINPNLKSMPKTNNENNFRNKEEKKFWMEVYVSCFRTLTSEEARRNANCSSYADIAIKKLRDREELTSEKADDILEEQKKAIAENQQKMKDMEDEVISRMASQRFTLQNQSTDVETLKVEAENLKDNIRALKEQSNDLKRRVERLKIEERKLTSTGVMQESDDYRSPPNRAAIVEPEEVERLKSPVNSKPSMFIGRIV